MHSLVELQRAFARAIAAGDDSVAGLVIGGRFTGAERINVYRNNYQESLHGALRDVYPVVARLVGEDFFRYAVSCYLEQYPLHQGSLIGFGDTFATFLGGFEPAAGLPYLEDVARLEWAWHEAFHAHNGDTMAPGRLARLDGYDAERLRFRLAPATRLIASRYPLLRIWEANQPEHTEVETVRLDQGPDHLLVLRIGLRVEIVALEEAEYVFLDALGSGAELGTACEIASARDAGFDPGGEMARHVRMGTIVDVIPPLPVGFEILIEA